MARIQWEKTFSAAFQPQKGHANQTFDPSGGTGPANTINYNDKYSYDSIAREEESFSEAYVNEFHRKVDEYLENGWKESKADPCSYGASFEQTLLNRIAKYRRNYFLWVEDISLPTTNNLSERGLRCVKSHMKILELTKSMPCNVYAKGTLIRLLKSSLHRTEYISENRVKKRRYNRALVICV